MFISVNFLLKILLSFKISFFQVFLGFYRSEIRLVMIKLWAFKVVGCLVVHGYCTINLYYVQCCCIELCTSLPIRTIYSMLQTANYDASVVYSIFSMGFSMDIT